MQILKNKKKGFTLIELLVVIAVIAILVSIMVPVVSNSTTRAAAAANAANLRTVEAMLTTLRLTNPESFDTWAERFETVLGEDLSDGIRWFLNLFGGLGDALDDRFHTITASGNTLTLPFDPGSIDVPVSVGMNYVHTDSTVYKLEAGTPMTLYIGEYVVVCSYGDYTVEDFADIADDGKLSRDPDSGSSSSGGGCVTPDTLVTLADGTKVRIDALTGSEELLVWNHYTGAFDSAPVAYMINHGEAEKEMEVIYMTFDNGKVLKIINEHVFYDADLNKYVAVTSENVDSFLGHSFMAQSGDELEKTELVKIQRQTESTEIYEVVSYKYLTCFTEDILTSCAYLDVLLNPFEIDTDTMAYDAQKMQADIEAYGLMEYDLWAPFVSEEVFEMHNAETLMVSLGKDNLTLDEIFILINMYNTYTK